MATPVPRISIAMPCFNAERTVGRAVESIRHQTLTDWELVVVDDGSTDGSAAVIESIARQDERVRLVRQDHAGVVGAANRGASLARGILMARMDADDVSRPMRFERQVELLDARPELDAVSCRVKFAGDVEAAGGYAYHVDWANQCMTEEAIALNRFIDLPVPHPTLLYRREAMEAHGGYRDGNFPEDYELFLRWVDGGVRIEKVDEVLFDWHDPPTRLSRTDPRYDMEAFHRCKAPWLARAIASRGCADRELWIWGAGRPSRKAARFLEEAWKEASGFIDIDPRKIGRCIAGRPVVASTELPPAEGAVIVSYVGSRGARDLIRSALLAAGRVEGVDFWIAA